VGDRLVAPLQGGFVLTDIVRVEDEYYVRASSALADDRTRVLKYGDTFAVFNRYGDIEPIGPSRFGLFHAETRHLSRFTLRLNQKQPLLLSSTIRDDNAFLSVDLTHVDTSLNGAGDLPRGTVHTFRLQFLRESACYQYFRLLNYGLQPVQISLLLQFDADFADIFEVRGTKRAHKGERLPDHADGNRVLLSYNGLDRVLRTTSLDFSPQPSTLSTKEASFQLTLEPKEEKVVSCIISCERESRTRDLVPFHAAYRDLEKEVDRTGIDDCALSTSSEAFNAWLKRSSADLRMLMEGNPEGPYPYAGVPWFNTVFGRDGIITALECLWMAPRIAEGVLKYLAETQATEEVPERDAEPGKILHEMRRGEMSVLNEVPFGRYYGSVDSTPLFVMLAGAYFRRTANLSFLNEVWPNIKRAIQWIDTYGDRDQDGFVEYAQRSSRGLVQQGWKDSNDSVFHADGTLAEAPIALCEVQGYVYAAKLAAARLSCTLGDKERCTALEAQAETLRTRFEEAFWCDDLSTYALALDGNKKPCRVQTSNAGHCLYAGIARPDRARLVAETLLSPDSFSGWGIRTVAAGQARYNPLSYHNGSIWPHDNSLIASGLAKYECKDLAGRILLGLLDASRWADLRRLPE